MELPLRRLLQSGTAARSGDFVIGLDKDQGGFKKTLTRWAAITERRFPIGLERRQVVAFKPVTKPALRLLESALDKDDALKKRVDSGPCWLA